MITMNIDDYAKRSKRAAQSDGLNDVLAGIALLAILFMQYAGAQARATIHGHNFWETRAFQEGHIFFALAICAQFALIFLSRRTLEQLRQRYVYPRMGYFSSRGAPKHRKLLMVTAGVSLILVMGIAGKVLAGSGRTVPLWPVEMTVVVIGLISGIGFAVHFAQLGFARHLALAVLSVGAALLLATVPLSWEYRVGWLVLLIGAASIAAGTAAFMRLLRLPTLSEGDAE